MPEDHPPCQTVFRSDNVGVWANSQFATVRFLSLSFYLSLCHAQYAMPTADNSPITQPPVRYVLTTVPHSRSLYTLHCAVRFPLKICLFQLGDPHLHRRKISFGQPDQPPQTASQSSLPSFHNTPDRQTDRQKPSFRLYQYSRRCVSYMRRRG